MTKRNLRCTFRPRRDHLRLDNNNGVLALEKKKRRHLGLTNVWLAQHVLKTKMVNDNDWLSRSLVHLIQHNAKYEYKKRTTAPLFCSTYVLHYEMNQNQQCQLTAQDRTKLTDTKSKSPRIRMPTTHLSQRASIECEN